MTDRYLNPLTDFGFHKLFGAESNKPLLIDFLNQLLPNHNKIKDLTYTTNKYNDFLSSDSKQVYDLDCINDQNRKFVVQIQRTYAAYMRTRSILCSTFHVQEVARKDDWDINPTAIYIIAILDVDFWYGGESKFVRKVNLREENNKIFYDNLTYIYVELPKFTKVLDEVENKLDKWLYVLKNIARLNDKPQVLREEVFQQFFEAAEVARLSPEEQEMNEYVTKIYRDWINCANYALEEKREKQRKEESQKIAQGMKRENISIELITELTDLDAKEIEKL